MLIVVNLGNGSEIVSEVTTDNTASFKITLQTATDTYYQNHCVQSELRFNLEQLISFRDEINEMIMKMIVQRFQQ